jgi:hypothetical protein
MAYRSYAEFARTEGAKDLAPRKRRGQMLREKGQALLADAKGRGSALLTDAKGRGSALLAEARSKAEPYAEKAADYINPKRKALREALSAELSTKKRQSDRKKKAAMIAGGIAGAGAIGLAAARYGGDALTLQRNVINKAKYGNMNPGDKKATDAVMESVRQQKRAKMVANVKNRVSNQQLETGLSNLKRGLQGRPGKIGGGILGAGLTAAGVMAYLKNKKKKGG